jgi:SAM-dependent methyltransferase
MQRSWFNRIAEYVIDMFERLYLPIEHRTLRRARNLRLIPTRKNRLGGKATYAEWGYVTGIFQTLLHLNLKEKENNVILDIGCGTGLLAIASEPFLGDKGHYIGIDVSAERIAFCQRHYPRQRFEFQHLNVTNHVPPKWAIADASVDMLLALSVWTHMNQADAVFYFTEINRVLKPNHRAIVTFFILDETYYRTVGQRTSKTGRFHNTAQNQWIFDQPLAQSKNWFYPAQVKQPDDAIGITPAGIEQLLAGTSLQLLETYPGNWKEIPGVYFQDILIFQKMA